MGRCLRRGGRRRNARDRDSRVAGIGCIRSTFSPSHRNQTRGSLLVARRHRQVKQRLAFILDVHDVIRLLAQGCQQLGCFAPAPSLERLPRSPVHDHLCDLEGVLVHFSAVFYRRRRPKSNAGNWSTALDHSY
eukprot:928399-Rhodomonas_salina.1